MAEQQYRIHIRQGEFELDVEGDRAFVEAYMEAFLADEADLEIEGEQETKPGRPKRRGKKQGTSGARRAEPALDPAALRAFMKGRGPVTNKQRYLEYMRFWASVGVKEVHDADIHACFSGEGLPVPPTGRQNFGSLRADGLVKTGSRRGFWALTPSGAAGGGAKAVQPKGKPKRASSKAPVVSPKSKGRPARKRRAGSAPAVAPTGAAPTK